jgi:hypothetical protein
MWAHTRHAHVIRSISHSEGPVVLPMYSLLALLLLYCQCTACWHYSCQQ